MLLCKTDELIHHTSHGYFKSHNNKKICIKIIVKKVHNILKILFAIEINNKNKHLYGCYLIKNNFIPILIN